MGKLGFSTAHSISTCIIICISYNIYLFSILTPVQSFDSLLQLPRSGSSRNRPRSTRILNVNDFGAKGDGLIDDTQALTDAWKLACSCPIRSKIIVPSGNTYLVRPTDFAGPCRSKVTFRVSGSIVAPKDPESWNGLNRRKWLYFVKVNHLTVEGGGTVNGSGHEWWARSCKINTTNHGRKPLGKQFSFSKSKNPTEPKRFLSSLTSKTGFNPFYLQPCRHAPTVMTFHRCKYLKVRKLTMVDSQQMHMAFTHCLQVAASNLIVLAPFDSPNTDGIHISTSTRVELKNSVIRTGDDCVSIVGNSSQIRVRNITCGPGHGISIGSLGKSKSVDQVQDISVNGAYLSNTENGMRIKTWQGGSGFATNITFQNIQMENVTNPIIIDQYYCDSLLPCPNQTQAVRVESVSFMGIKGTSATEEAIRFACSDSSPCKNLHLEDIQLVPYSGDETTTSFCWQAEGSSSGLIYPPTCFSCNESFIEQKVPSGSVLKSI